MNKLIILKPDIKTVFVGDTHGDFETTLSIFKKYPPEKNRLVFLGDYVDRGDMSLENIEFLIKQKELYPDRVILLAGNHDYYGGNMFPSSFWDNLIADEIQQWRKTFKALPLFVSMGDIIACHAALPDVRSLKDLDNPIEEDIRTAVWGDYGSGRYADSIRPRFDEEWFERTLKQINKKILIRGHQPGLEADTYGTGRLITLMTSRFLYEVRVGVVEKGGGKVKVVYL